MSVCQLSDSGQFVAVLGGVASLQQVRRISGSDQAHKGALYRLKPDVEIDIRRRPSTTRGTLNQHFATHVNTVWRCFNLPHDIVDSLMSDAAPYHIPINQGIVNAMGVEFDIMSTLEEAVPQVLEEIDPPTAEASSSTAGATSSGAEMHPDGNAMRLNMEVGKVLDRLHSIAKPRQGGIITHTFEPVHVVNALLLKSLAKPSASLHDLLAASAPFLGGPLKQTRSQMNCSLEGLLFQDQM